MLTFESFYYNLTLMHDYVLSENIYRNNETNAITANFTEPLQKIGLIKI